MRHANNFPGQLSTLAQALAWTFLLTTSILSEASDPAPSNIMILPADPAYVDALAGLNQLLGQASEVPGFFPKVSDSQGGSDGGSSYSVTISFDPGGPYPPLISTDIVAASDLDLASLGNPAILSDTRLVATADFKSGRDFIIGPDASSIDTNGHELELSGTLTVNADLHKTGSGTLILSGTNDWKAGLLVWEGVLQGSADSLQTAIYNNYPSTVDFHQEVDGTHREALQNEGTLRKTGAGKLTLTAASQNRRVEVMDGTLRLQGNGELGAGADLLVAPGATLDMSAASSGQAATGLAGGGRIVLNQHGMGLDLEMEATFSGSLAGPGGLQLDGLLNLTGKNTYSGQTRLYSYATLVLAGAGNLSPRSSLFIDEWAEFDISQADGAREVASLNGAAHGRVNLGSNSLTVGRDDADSLFSGTLHGTLITTGETQEVEIDGQSYSFPVVTPDPASRLVKVGSGKLTLGDFSASDIGRLVIQGGSVEGKASSLPDVIRNDGTLILNEALTLPEGVTPAPAGTLYASYAGLARYEGHIRGSGSLVKQGNGALWLTGRNTYTGGTTVEDGILVGDTMSLPGDIENRAGVAFNQTADGTFPGSISGDGILLKHGAGTLTLAGHNTYTGGTVFSGGLRVGEDASLGDAGSPLMFVDGTLHVSDDLEFTRLLYLSDAGGAIHTHGHTLALQGSLAGPGALDKLGQGALALPEDLAHDGTMAVHAGTLVLSGGYTGDITVAPKATLAIGAVASTAARGEVEFAKDSILRVGVDASGASGQILANRVRIEGGKVLVQPMAGDYTTQTRYTLISTTDGISGEFDTVASTLAFLRPSLSYDARHAYLTLARNDTLYAEVANTRDQRGIANILTSLAQTGAPSMAAVFTQLDQLTAEQARAGFDSISATGRATPAQALDLNQRTVYGQIAGRLGLADASSGGSGGMGLALNGLRLAYAQRTLDDARPLDAVDSATGTEGLAHAVWLRGYAGNGRFDGNGGAGDTSLDYAGIIFGYDRLVAPRLRLGGMLSFNQPSTDQSLPDAHLDTDNYQLGLYGRYRQGPWRVDGFLGHGWNRNTSRRTVVVGALSETARADFDGNTTSGYIEAGYRMDITSSANGLSELEPIAALQWSHHGMDGYTETGATLSQSMPEDTSISLRSLLGVRLARVLGGNDAQVTLEGRVAWAHDWREARQLSPYLAGDPSATPFTVASATTDDDSTLIGVGILVERSSKLQFFAEMGGEFGRNHRNHDLSLGLRYRW